MYIISFDIGAKNLAYCLLYVNKDKGKDETCIKKNGWYEKSEYPLKIIDWDVIDICVSNEKNMCCVLDCKTKPKYEKEGKFYCMRHAKKNTRYLVVPKHKKIEKMKLDELKNFNDTICDLANKRIHIDDNVLSILSKKEETTNIKKQKLKKVDYIKIIEDILEKRFYNEIEKKNASNVSLVTMGKNMKLKLDKALKDYDIHTVIIENQISPIANRMKTLQGMVTQYFIMNNVDEVEFISSANKLKDFSDSKKTKYSERKKMGIKVMSDILNDIDVIGELDIFCNKGDTNNGDTNNVIINVVNSGNSKQNWTNVFKNHSKKDDLADSFLQALWYINHKL